MYTKKAGNFKPMKKKIYSQYFMIHARASFFLALLNFCINVFRYLCRILNFIYHELDFFFSFLNVCFFLCPLAHQLVDHDGEVGGVVRAAWARPAAARVAVPTATTTTARPTEKRSHPPTSPTLGGSSGPRTPTRRAKEKRLGFRRSSWRRRLPTRSRLTRRKNS